MIDTHCHLTFPDFAGRVDVVMREAAVCGVSGAITVATTTADAVRALEVARSHPRIWCSAGVHPLYADEAVNFDDYLRVIQDPKCVAWGELGLDNHYADPPRKLQDRVLADQLALIQASRIGKPVIVHCRDAFEDLVSALRASGIAPERFVFHCFTGDQNDARMVLDFGAWISFTGVVTFQKKSDHIQAAARIVPDDRLMIETDAPFLTPEPHRKVRPNAPKYSIDTARFVADLRRTPWDDFHRLINENTAEFFKIDVARAEQDAAEDFISGPSSRH